MLTTVIGSYPLSYRELGSDAISRSVRDQLDAGIELVSDGQTRYDMVEYFSTAIDGYSYDGKSYIDGRIGKGDPETFVQDLRFARGIAPRVKGIITGPVTMVFSSKIRHYYKGHRDEQVYLDTATALLGIARTLEENGAEWIQIDEPFLSVGAPMRIARQAVETIATNLRVPVALHVCGRVVEIFKELLRWQGITMLSHAFNELSTSQKMLGFGCIDTQSTQVEDTEKIENLVRRAIQKLPKESIAIHPDCGLRLLPRDIAFEKMKRMVVAARRAAES